MLSRLTIKNAALIDSAVIEFSGGLNILSGETGSGKSVIIECLNFVLGAKADKTMISAGEEYCTVTAEFDISRIPELKAVFDDAGFEYEDTLIISRRFSVDGKGDIRVNGNAVTVGMLKKFTVFLVDIHGQSEHFYLLKEANQLDLIDKYSGLEAAEIKELILNEYSTYKTAVKNIESLGGDEQSRAMRMDILSYQINEIKEADIYDGEEEELLALKKKLANLEKIAFATNSAYDALDGDNGALDTVANALRELNALSAFGDDYSELAERLDAVRNEIADISDTLSGLKDEEFDESELENTEERLETIKKIFKKYGRDYTAVADFLQNCEEEYDKLLHFGELAAQYLEDKAHSEYKLYKLYEKLSDVRRKSAKEFANNVTTELKELGMNKAVFEITFAPLPSAEDCNYNSTGQDRLEFEFSANLGEPLKPLAKIISGGEISRFMLAVKTAASRIQSVSTFVFDEIDAGISGHIAEVVARKFAKISKSVQVIAITHLPQISAMGDTSLLIYKNEVSGRTRTHVQRLVGDERVQEITRLVGGTSESEAAVTHAKNMLATADEYKKAL